MSDLPKLTEKAILNLVGERSLRLGREYVADGSLFETRLQGKSIRARCHGNSGGPYRVIATFNASGISSDCSCPVGGGGQCKHVGALLLAWMKEPGQFTAVEELDQALKNRSKEELVAILRQVIRQHPDLESLLHTPLPTAGGKRTKPVKPETYQKQATAVFSRAGDGYTGWSDIEEELAAIVEIGNDFVAQEDWEGAAAVSRGMLDALLDVYDEFDDGSGSLDQMVADCVNNLEKCLDAAGSNWALREPMFRALFEVYLTDIRRGGVGLSDEAVECLDEKTTPDERRHLADWIRQALPNVERGWASEALGGFLLDLEQGSMDDEAYLRLCRETGRTGDLVERLLKLDRVDEAAKELQKAKDHELVSLAELFVTQGHGDVAEPVLATRAKDIHDGRVFDWLRRRYASRNDGTRELEMAARMFDSYPTVEGYRELRDRAIVLGQWESLEKKLKSALTSSRRNDLLIRICLDEGEVDTALRLMEEANVHGVKMEVAAAAENVRPGAALKIYRKAAEDHIAYRTRGGYQEACKHLKNVQKMYAKMGEADGWEQYINKVRQKNHSLRALMEELAAAQL
ncbi:MAG: hypothetical protein JWL69_1104 [Phycisphaerales bacterium]|nr:hypothetical protein [Phycisphaerales bacterium]MDB5354013.1 hypothetical protein [Phycisphaerales bacterium]